MYNYTPQATHHAKFDFDPMTWVVWANSQFATVLGIFLSSFLPVFFMFSSARLNSRRRMNRHHSTLSRLALRQGFAFWGLEYLIFTFLPIFHQKSSKLSPKYAISSQNSETWNTRYFRNYTTERRENLTQSWEHKVEFYDAIWWLHNKSKMADGRYIEKSFLAISRRHRPIDRSTRILEWRWRITCRYRSRDQNCHFRGRPPFSK